jgi:hypothetical protein
MARKSAHEEEMYDYIILDLLPTEPTGVTWSDTWRLAKKRGISSKQTFGNHLKKLQSADLVMHEGTEYWRNPMYLLPFEKFPAGKYRRVGKRKVVDDNLPTDASVWHDLMWEIDVDQADKGYDLEAETYPSRIRYSSIKNVKEMLAWLEPQLSLVIMQYLLALQELVKIPSKAAARQYLELVTRLRIQSQLMLRGYDVWRKRRFVKFDGLLNAKQEEVFPRGFRIGNHPALVLGDLSAWAHFSLSQKELQKIYAKEEERREELNREWERRACTCPNCGEVNAPSNFEMSKPCEKCGMELNPNLLHKRRRRIFTVNRNECPAV